jgi:hypothetical protein
MRIFVKYNGEGQILSVSKVDSMSEGVDQPYGLLEENEFVLEAPADEELLNLDALQIHTEYQVDVDQSRLVKKE